MMDYSGALPDTDYIGSEAYLLMFVFAMPELQAAYDNPIAAALNATGKAVHDLAVRPNKKLRERAFLIWAGDYENQFGSLFMVGIPEPSPPEITTIFETHMKRVRGYQRLRVGMAMDVGIRPLARYDHGDLVMYINGMEGLVMTDEHLWGSGLRTYTRAAAHAEMIGREYFGPLDRNAVPLTTAQLQQIFRDQAARETGKSVPDEAPAQEQTPLSQGVSKHETIAVNAKGQSLLDL